MNQTTPDDLKTATTDPVRAALADKIEQVPVGPFAILLGMNDGTHFKEIVSARAMIVAALRTPAPLHSGEPVVREKICANENCLDCVCPERNFCSGTYYTSPPTIELDGGVTLEQLHGKEVQRSIALEIECDRLRALLAVPKPERAVAREALIEKEAKRRCTENGYSLDRTASEDSCFRHNDFRPWWKARYEPMIRREIEKLERAGFALSPVALHDGGK